jgi:soluble lytic murein transglycosylase-like protein
MPEAQSEQLAEVSSKIEEVDQKSVAYQKEVERDRALSAFLAKRYRVSHDVALDFVRIAFAAGHRIGVDPLLVLAVMAVESRLNPIAESEAGAKGLMQIIPRYHPEKLVAFGGEKAIFEPHANIVVGSQILREYIQRAGDVSDGLRIYAGVPPEGENSYPARVLDEKRRLQHVVSQQRKAGRDAPSNRVAL